MAALADDRDVQPHSRVERVSWPVAVHGSFMIKRFSTVGDGSAK